MSDAARSTVATAKVERVLVSTDFSPLACRAIPYAYALTPPGGSVVLLHVVQASEPAVTPNPLYAHYTPGHPLTQEERAKQTADLTARLRGLVPADAQARGVVTTFEVIEAREAAGGILAAADRHGVDLICMATHGRSGLSKLVLGSVAQEVLRKSARPLLVVPAK